MTLFPLIFFSSFKKNSLLFNFAKYNSQHLPAPLFDKLDKMAWFTITGLLFFWILFSSVTLAHRNGADIKSCADMQPMHPGNPQPQTTPAPFTVTLDKTKLTSDEQLSITLSVMPDVDSFKGFLIQVRQVGGAIPALGMFANSYDGTTKVLDCEFGSAHLTQSAITHGINRPKKNITVHWTPARHTQPWDYQV